MKPRRARFAVPVAGVLLACALLWPRGAFAEDLVQVFDLARSHDAGL